MTTVNRHWPGCREGQPRDVLSQPSDVQRKGEEDVRAGLGDQPRHSSVRAPEEGGSVWIHSRRDGEQGQEQRRHGSEPGTWADSLTGAIFCSSFRIHICLSGARR